MTIKGVLFDMDGVLIDAKDWHYDALNRALELFGYTISRESHLSTFDGMPTRQKLQILSRSCGLPIGLHEFLNTLKQIYTLEISYQRCKPVFNHQYALSRLKSQGYKLAVCSNSVHNTVREMMKLSGLEPYLDLMVSNEDVSKAKPDPEMYLKAMNNLRLKPQECLVLEDNEHGIQAAQAAGAHLMKIGLTSDVTYQAIISKILSLELG